MNPALIVSIVISLALGIVGLVFVSKISRRRNLLNLLNNRLLSVRVPQYDDTINKEKDTFIDANKFAQLISGLARPKTAFVFELAVHNVGDEISFYVSVPRVAVESISRQIQGLWPGAQVSVVEDFTIFNTGGSIRSGYFKNSLSSNLPIRTYDEAKLDTFATILSNFSKLQTIGEGLVLQLIMQPATRVEKGKIVSNIGKLKRGAKLDAKGRVIDLPKKPKDKQEYREPVTVDDESIKLLERKISRPLFYTNARIISSAPTENRAEELLRGLALSFDQFSSPRHNDLKFVNVKSTKKMVFDYTFRRFRSDQKMVLNADEIASFFHFPTAASQNVPKVNWTHGKEVHPPLNLPTDGTLLGRSSFRGEEKNVFLKEEDRRRHAYIIGQTGTGKTALLQNMIMSDVSRGKGVAVIDPHGDLINAVLNNVPENRQKDVIVFDPGDIEKPLGLNMIENDPRKPEQKTFIVNEMQSIFNRLFSQETMGPMFEQYMRNALYLLMEDTEDIGTLMEVPRIFTDIEFRKRKLARAKNPAVIDFWEKEAVKAGGEASLQNMTPYITSKFNNFIANDYVRPIIGQQKSALNFRSSMDEGKILLVNLSKGKIGDINAGLLGMVIVGKLLMSALSRVDINESDRKDFNLYIDEFQNFTTDSISTILSEARKYRLNLVIAHQFIAQLDEKIRDSVFGNVGSMVSFRVGSEDAEVLERQFEPVFDKNDLINIDNFNAYIRIIIDGQVTAPFNIKTLPPTPGNTQLGFRLREFSRNKYGRNKLEVESDIRSRLRDNIEA